MGASIPSPLFGVFLAAMLVMVILSILAWRWAVRRPANPDMSFLREPAVRPFVYAAIGASDVVGVGATDPNTQSWVNVVAAHMPTPIQLVRLGRSGITLHDANALEVPRAVEAKPDLVTIWNCVNDAVRITPVDVYTSELRQALATLTKRTAARVLVLNLPDLSLLLQYSAYSAQQDLVRAGVLRWNQAIDQTVRAFGDRVKVLDLFEMSHEVRDHPEYISRDNFHPSTEGYRRLGNLVWSALVESGWVPGEEPAGDAGVRAEAS